MKEIATRNESYCTILCQKISSFVNGIRSSNNKNNDDDEGQDDLSFINDDNRGSLKKEEVEASITTTGSTEGKIMKSFVVIPNKSVLLSSLFSWMSIKKTKDRHFIKTEKDGKTTDPTLFLNNECLFLILSFVGVDKVTKIEDGDGEEEDEENKRSSPKEANHETTEGVDVTEANKNNDSTESIPTDILCSPMTPLLELVKFYFAFASLSRGWKRLVDEKIIHLGGLVRVDFGEFGTQEMTKNAIVWCCRHKPKLAAVTGIFPVHPDLGPTFMNMIQRCITKELVEMHFMYVVRADMSHPRVKEESIAQQKFQDIVIQCCPNLVCLKIDFAFAGDHLDAASEYIDDVSPLLFSLPSVRAAAFTFSTPSTVNETFITKLVRNFPSLSHVALRSNHGSILNNRDTVLHIQSNSLKALDVSSFSTNGIKMSLDCPNLQHFLFACEKMIDIEDGTPILFAKQKIIREGTTVPDSCCASLEFKSAWEWEASCDHMDFAFPFLYVFTRLARVFE